MCIGLGKRKAREYSPLLNGTRHKHSTEIMSDIIFANRSLTTCCIRMGLGLMYDCDLPIPVRSKPHGLYDGRHIGSGACIEWG